MQDCTEIQECSCTLLREPPSQHSMMSGRTEERRNTRQLWGEKKADLCSSTNGSPRCTVKCKKMQNWIESIILLLITDVCTHINNDGKARIQPLTLPRSNTRQLVDPPTGSQKHIHLDTPTHIYMHTLEAVDKSMDKENWLCIPAPPLPSSTTLGKFLNLSGPEFSIV